MANIKFPVTKFEQDKFQVVVDVNLYKTEVITVVIYKFSHLFYIHQQTDTNNSNLINIIFESKDHNLITEDIPKQFCNELIDQQVRFNTNAQFGHIRDMIVNEAFKPITSK
ncbi:MULTISPECIES: His-Xaa-Ser system protein HxsD [Bacteroidales]|uniref:His-Xaa-Ser system protein HxsD n=1 Tax=Bacteroidales TaxID=171549 RepID=UPI0022E7B68A|nr:MULTISPECIES: His-Xaa-Ser system protein HxsD [Bacteroidales]